MKPTLILTLGLLIQLSLFAQDASLRLWTNQQGRTVKATLVDVTGGNVSLQLENGTKSTVHLGSLSKGDQDYVQKYLASRPAAAMPTASANTPGESTWPKELLTVDPKFMVVTEGVQDDAARQYHYTTENFEFISSAPLAKTVMSEVAADFVLTYKATTMMPWGWEPKPKEGTRFKILLAETKDDYVKLFGGNDVTSSTVVDGNSLIMFSALGLKKVGQRYQYDARQKDPGSVTFITAYGLLYQHRGWMYPWTRYAYPYIIQRYAYQDNGTLKFSDLDSALKKCVKYYSEHTKTEPDLARMIKTMRASNDEVRTDAKELNLQLHLDSALLAYYFGFLDGDGSGRALHEYHRNVLARAKQSKLPTTPGMETATPEQLLNKIFAGRSDEQIAAEMTEKFARAGLRFKK